MQLKYTRRKKKTFLSASSKKGFRLKKHLVTSELFVQEVKCMDKFGKKGFGKEFRIFVHLHPPLPLPVRQSPIKPGSPYSVVSFYTTTQLL